METLAVNRPTTSVPDLQADLRRARWFANWMDTRFSLFGIRFGMDHVVSLIPVAGDTIGAIAGIYPIYLAHRHRLGRVVELTMAMNLLIEWLVGLVPWVGDLGDVWFKANVRNLKLLEKAAAQKFG